MTEAIRVDCGNCGSTIKAPPKYQGKRVKCPQCAKGVTIPAAEEEAEFLDDDAFDDEDDFLSDDYEDYDGDGEDVDEFEESFGHTSAPPPKRSSTRGKKKKSKRSSRSRSRANSAPSEYSGSGGGGGDGVMGWVVWIGIIMFINFLS